MTSGNFQSFPTSAIVIQRDERQRREVTKIEELAESLNRTGLINPIVITKEGVLVAGERRLTAARSLGWTAISVQFVEDLDPLDLQIIELEENVKRTDLSWQDRITAINRYHKLKVSMDPEWSATKTAKALGEAEGHIYTQLSVAKEIENGNARVANADKYSTARNVVERETSRRRASALGDVDKGIAAVVNDPSGMEEGVVRRKTPPLLLADFNEWGRAYTDRPFNLIHCDFPYGVNLHKSGQAANQEYGSYADGEDVYWTLLDTLEASMSNVVAESAHLIFWFSMDYYAATLNRLTIMGWRVSPFPLIWFKNDNTGIIPDAQRGPRRVYETAFFASRGDRLLTSRGAKANAFAHPGRDKSIHMNEKPVPMLRHFMEMVVDDNTRALDPTCGSANALKAATALGAPTVLGLERDPEFFARSSGAYWGEAEEGEDGGTAEGESDPSTEE